MKKRTQGKSDVLAEIKFTRSATATQNTCVPASPSPVEAGSASAFSASDRLDEMLERLEKRLTPVLCIVAPQIVCGGNPHGDDGLPPASQIANDFRMLANRQHNAADRILKLLDQLEI